MNATFKRIAVLGAGVIVVSCLLHAQQTTSVETETRSISPDQKWEYHCTAYGMAQCAPEILKAGETEAVLDLENDANVYSPEALRARVVWSPDSKRFAFNFSPPHAHHTTYRSVAFYQLNGDKWESLLAIDDNESIQKEILSAAKKFLKKPNRKGEDRSPEVLKIRAWSDANTANAYATWSDEKDSVALTFKFDGAGKAKIMNVRRLPAKELEAEQ